MASDPGETGRLSGRTVMLLSQLGNHDRLLYNYVASSSTGLFTHYCYANEVGRYTKPSKFWGDDGIQRTP